MKDPKAEECRRNADRARRVADRACEGTVRETFQRLADGYDAIAEHLERLADRSREKRDGELTRLPRGPLNGKDARQRRIGFLLAGADG
jgi:hypothetical protein